MDDLVARIGSQIRDSGGLGNQSALPMRGASLSH
jgi:hypothetical protein